MAKTAQRSSRVPPFAAYDPGHVRENRVPFILPVTKALRLAVVQLRFTLPRWPDLASVNEVITTMGSDRRSAGTSGRGGCEKAPWSNSRFWLSTRQSARARRQNRLSGGKQCSWCMQSHLRTLIPARTWSSLTQG